MSCARNTATRRSYGPVLLNRSKLVAAKPERCARRMAKRGDRGLGLDAGIDEIFGQGAKDAAVTGVDVGNEVRIPAQSAIRHRQRH
jgi:hypothetical protein